MPVHRRINSQGSFYQWGESGKKYYYISGNNKSRENAKAKATRQGIAIHASGWRQ